MVDISKKIDTTSTGLYLAAECRVRTKKLKDLYYKIKGYFRGGTNKKRFLKKTKKHNNRVTKRRRI